MKSLQEIQNLNKLFEKKFNFQIDKAQQGSERWFQAKLGVLSGSRASEIVAKVDSQTRLSYMCELVGQVCTSSCEEINAKALDWGKQYEAASRAYYELANDATITEVGFIFKDEEFREGCSADGLVTDVRGLEIKCPYATENYIKFLIAAKIKPEWKWQNQFNMRVTGAKIWDFAQYDPRMQIKPMHTMRDEWDEKMQKTLDDAVPQFIHDMDKMLAEIGVPFGEQWLRLAKASSMRPDQTP